ncbi:polysaccharide biosynthesis protein [Micromonosporaceae bacterium DT194]|uniref:polysaccharide biosynthesis protein n=1 Tax=Melissospora conviva TaxID=3388432 RepID=UPI003C28BF8A
MSEAVRRRRLAALGTAGLAVTAAGVVVNALAYVLPVIGARQLEPASLSALATLLALGAILGVPATGLQMAVAVHRARHGAASAATSTRLTVAVTVGTLAVVLPVATVLLRLPADATALLGVITCCVVVAGRWLGELQGDQRFLRLAAGMAVLAAGRYGGVAVGLLAGAGLTGALLAGAAASALVLPLLAQLARNGGAAGSTGPGSAAAVPVRAVFTAGGATLAMLVVSYADLLLARRFLEADVSAAYAVGTVLTKGALWAPQVVTVLVLPRLAKGDRRSLTTALALVAGFGVLLVTASALAGELAFGIAGGAAYTGFGGYAPIFAATGALYALVFVLVNAQVAAGARWPSAPLWAGTAGYTVAVATVVPQTLAGIAVSALVTAAAMTAATGLLVLLRSRRPAPAGVLATPDPRPVTEPASTRYPQR